MHQDELQLLFKNHRETALADRYICNDHIVPILKKLPVRFQVSKIGKSVNEETIYKVQFGSGAKKGLSVSISNLSIGIKLNVFWSSMEFLNVIIPLAEK